MKEQNKNNVICIRVNNDFKKQYKKICEFHGYTYSKRILSIIEKDFEFLKLLKNNS
jgi:hypothetical protein